MNPEMDSVFEQLKAASLREYTDSTKSPTNIDNQISSIVDAYLGMPGEDRAALRTALPRECRDFLLEFARRMAVVGLRKKSQDRLFEGLVALAIENQYMDPRDTLIACSLLRHSARKLKVNPESLFNRAAEFAEGETRRTLQNFHLAACSSLSAAGYNAVMTSEGLDYKMIDRYWWEWIFEGIQSLGVLYRRLRGRRGS